QATGLPSGLTLNSAGVLSGIFSLTADQTFAFTVTVSSPGVTNSATQTFHLHYKQAPLTITTATITPAREAEPYSFTLQSMFGLGPTTWGLISSDLPPGLTLTTGGSLQGTPQM